MKLVAFTPKYFPDQCSGGEATLHDYLKAAQQRGVDVHVVAMKCSVKEFEGIPVTLEDNKHTVCKDADVFITHLSSIGVGINAKRRYKKPLIFYAHNDFKFNMIKPHNVDHIIYNSKWIAKKRGDYYGIDYSVMRPILFANYKRDDNAKYVTIVNLNKNKGGELFKKVAEQMEDVPFLAVTGGYYKQQDSLPENVKVIPNTPNMEDVYYNSKVVIIPSEYESYSRVAVEAMSAGIPIICTPTAGLKENCGKDAFYVGAEDGDKADRGSVDEWVKAIKSLYNGESAQSGFTSFSKRRFRTYHKTYMEQDAKKFVTLLKTLSNET